VLEIAWPVRKERIGWAGDALSLNKEGEKTREIGIQ
jgi:hypothetical protein